MKLAIYNTGTYANYNEADKSGALYKHDFNHNCYTHAELAHHIKDAVKLIKTSVEMMDGSKPFNCAFEYGDIVIDNLKDKSIQEIIVELGE